MGTGPISGRRLIAFNSQSSVRLSSREIGSSQCLSKDGFSATDFITLPHTFLIALKVFPVSFVT
jgi:hypothetical protein